MASDMSVADQIRQLNDARKLVLGDVNYYSNVVRSIPPIISSNPAVEVRRWVTDFLAEAFATPALPNGEKETMQPYILVALETLLENKTQDVHVLRSAIQTAASIYPLALRWIVNNGYDTVTWERMLSIKQRILQIWETAPSTVKICCIKFAQRVVLAQTLSSGVEHRHASSLDISLDRVPPGHQLLDPRNLEAEASGLLDRMLSVLQESDDALLVDATLNSLSILARTRPDTSNRILNAVLAFNPLQSASSPVTPRMRVMIRSMEKTARMLLIHLSKRDPHNPNVPRMHQHIDRMRALAESFNEANRKRPLESNQQEEYDAKRQRTATTATTPAAAAAATPATTVQLPILGPGPYSVADIFTYTKTDGLKTFDLSQVPAPLVAKIAVTALSKLDNNVFAKALEGIRDRLQTIAEAPVTELNPNTAPLGVDDDDDDYEPDFYQAEDTEQILNKLDGISGALEPVNLEDNLALRSFSLPQPPQLTPDTALRAGTGTINRVLDMMRSIDEPAAKKLKAGFSRLAASSGNREAWMTILTRLATRSSAGLEQITVKGEAEDIESFQSLSNSIREVLYNYVMEDFRKHIDVAVQWLCEEWYNDKIQSRSAGDHPMHYEKYALRLLDGFLPYLHPQDKVLTRFLSEIPELNRSMLSRVKHMCRDPSIVQLALTSLLYLALMRPPAKEMALDTVQDIWTDYEDARAMAGKYLSKYRPAFLEAATSSNSAETTATSSAVIAA